MFKQLIFSALTTLTFAAQATEFKTFSEVAQAVERGSELVFVLSLKACEGDFPDLKISVKPNAFMLIPEKKVTASDKHFTLNHPKSPENPVIDYGKYTINADGRAQVKMTVMDARDYKKISSSEIGCELGKGFQVFSRD